MLDLKPKPTCETLRSSRPAATHGELWRGGENDQMLGQRTHDSSVCVCVCVCVCACAQKASVFAELQFGRSVGKARGGDLNW